MDRPRLQPVVWTLTAAALFGASTPAAKILLYHAGPITLAGLFYLGAAIAMVPFASRVLPSQGVWRRSVVKLGAAVLFGGVIAPVLLLLGLTRAPAASVSMWLALETVATSTLAALFC